MKKLITPIATAIATIALFAATPAMAVDLRQDKQLVKQAIAAAQEARHYYYGTQQLQKSERKLQRVRNDISGLSPSPTKRKLKYALDDAIGTLQSRYTAKYRKISVVESQGSISLRLINKLINNGGSSARAELDEVIHMVNNAHTAVHNDNMNRAVRLLRNAIQELRGYNSDRKIVNAIQETRSLIQTLNSNVRLMRKKQAMNQSRATIKSQIKNSRTYEEGAEGNKVRLGKTGEFMKRGFSMEKIHVGVNSGSFKKIMLTAKGSDLRVQNVTIKFGNGNTQDVYGGYISEGETLKINLNGDQRMIKAVKITATSPRGRGTGKGFMVLHAK